MNRTGQVNYLPDEVKPDAEVHDLDGLLDWLKREHG